MTGPPIIECVPNVSEGRDVSVIKRITDQVETVGGVRLLAVDPGAATNRTVITLVGPPEAVLKSAFRLARTTVELIDMTRHHGAHPRFGALDVCPLIPVSGITMDETVRFAHELARRLADELGLTIFCYEYAARSPRRKNLADVRSGEYEGLAEKLTRPDWKPDYGPAVFNARSGATAVGARDFLVAYNVNLNTTSTRRANAIAYDIREKGRIKTVDGTASGKPVLDENGQPEWIPGSLKAVKAVGWFIDEYGIAQISINLTNLNVTPLHVAFEETCRKAEERGVRVTGSELVGLIPMKAMLDAGRYFLKRQHRSTGVSDDELLRIAVRTLGLNELHPFKPEEKIIELAIADRSERKLVDRSVRDFVFATASESPAPGGGSVAALVGSLAAALGTMVANLSAHKRGWDDRWEEFSDWAERGKTLHDELLNLVDEDTQAFENMMRARNLPRESEEQKRLRGDSVAAAVREAVDVPFRVMRASLAAMDVLRAMAASGMKESVSDAGSGALCARCAVHAAGLNVRINAPGLEDTEAASAIRECTELEHRADEKEREILALAMARI